MEAWDMADKKNQDDHLERAMNQLADSVLGLSEEAFLAETSETTADPEHEAEQTRLVLRQASKTLDDVNKRMSDLGHSTDASEWLRGHWGYHNTCETCGSFVSFTLATGEMRGAALDGVCPDSDQYSIHRRKASSK
jgi:hypothetical protein